MGIAPLASVCSPLSHSFVYHFSCRYRKDCTAFVYRSILSLLTLRNLFTIIIDVTFFDSCASRSRCCPSAVTSATWRGHCAARATGRSRPSIATVPRARWPTCSSVKRTRPSPSRSATSTRSRVLLRA